MNLYTTLAIVKDDLRISVTEYDARLLRLIEGASRGIDAFCGRRFWTGPEARVQRALTADVTLLDDDCLSVSEIATRVVGSSAFSEGWDPDSWALAPYNRPVKNRIEIMQWSDLRFAPGEDVLVTGVWGYGDGSTATPWRSAGVTVTAATTTAETVTVSAPGALSAGQTIRVATEQMYVEDAYVANSVPTARVVRGVNHTAAAVHAAGAVQIARYPRDVERFCAWMVRMEFAHWGKDGFMQERIGDYFYSRIETDMPKQMRRCMSHYRRSLAA